MNENKDAPIINPNQPPTLDMKSENEGLDKTLLEKTNPLK